MISGKGSARVYPFLEAQKERTHSEVELCGVKALETRTPQYGVKGPSMLSKISHFDLVDGLFLTFSIVPYSELHVSLYRCGLKLPIMSIHGTLVSHLLWSAIYSGI